MKTLILWYFRLLIVASVISTIFPSAADKKALLSSVIDLTGSLKKNKIKINIMIRVIIKYILLKIIAINSIIDVVIINGIDSLANLKLSIYTYISIFLICKETKN
jgi:hypothetical protein